MPNTEIFSKFHDFFRRKDWFLFWIENESGPSCKVHAVCYSSVPFFEFGQHFRKKSQLDVHMSAQQIETCS